VPELPEVEVVRRGLEAHVVGRRIERVDVLHPRPVRRHLAGAVDFAALTTDRTVLGARRRGKYLWLPLDSGDAILGHLGMSGQMLMQPVGAPDERHLRVRFTLRGAGELRFVDQRIFGGLSV
jgi:formamidopyrimidine-DNA glycosylase